MFRLLGILLAGLLLPQAVLAQGGGGPPSPDMMIKRQDANGDGKLSRDEFRGPPQRFDMMDADKDGFLTKDEITAFRAGRGGGHGAAQGGMTGGNAPMFWLNGDQVRMLMSGTAIAHTSPRSGSQVSLKFKADGTLDGTAGGNTPITGSWQVRPDGQLCFDASALGNRLCFFLIRKGDKVQRLNNKKEPAKGIDWTIVSPGPDTAKVPDGVFR